MTGTVTSIRGTQQTYCRIRDSSGIEYFAHQKEFVNPSAMFVGSEVEFRVKLAKTGPRPEATDIVAIKKTPVSIAA